MTQQDFDAIVAAITAVILEEPIQLAMAEGTIRYGHAHPGDAADRARKIVAALQ